MISSDGNFWLKPAGVTQWNVGFTKEGLRQFGVLFVCESLVRPGNTVTPKTKLFAVEGLHRLCCIKGLFSQGEVTHVNKQLLDPSEITPETTLLTVKGTPNALLVL